MTISLIRHVVDENGNSREIREFISSDKQEESRGGKKSGSFTKGINRFSPRWLTPYALTQLCYRERIEDWHSDEMQMNMLIYQQFKKICSNAIKQSLRDIEEVIESGGMENIQGMNLLIENNAFLSACFLYCFSDADWLPPECLGIHLPDNTPDAYAEFVLGGAFLEACGNHDRLTDEMMKKINIDVFNRFFTLTETGMIPLPLRK